MASSEGIPNPAGSGQHLHTHSLGRCILARGFLEGLPKPIFNKEAMDKPRVSGLSPGGYSVSAVPFLELYFSLESHLLPDAETLKCTNGAFGYKSP